MQISLVCSNAVETQIALDTDAMDTLSAVLRFTSPLNSRCAELLEKFELLFVNGGASNPAAQPP